MSARCPNLFGRPAALLRSLSPVPISPNTVCVSASACDPWGEAPGAKGADTRKKLLTRSLRRSERSFVECSAVATGGRATAFLRVVARRCEAARGVGRPCLASVSRFGCDGFISQAITLGSMVLSQQVHSPLASFSHRRLTCRNFAPARPRRICMSALPAQFGPHSAIGGALYRDVPHSAVCASLAATAAPDARQQQQRQQQQQQQPPLPHCRRCFFLPL